jgi:hypothetical protein
MEELKGLNTTDFYSRFFVETALDKHVSASKEEINSIQSLGEKFLNRYHNITSTTPYPTLQEHATWYHNELLSALGYKKLETFFHNTNKSKGIPIRGKLPLIDNEELWIIEGMFGSSKKEVQPLEEIPNCHLLDMFGDNKTEYEVDKSQSFHKVIRSILAEENSCAWIIFLAGEKLYLFEREKTLSNGSYVEVDWSEVYSNKDTKLIKAIVGLFSIRAFTVINGDIAHHQLAETAHREAHGVTKSLKYGVRDALELLINEALYYHRNVEPSKTLAKLEKDLSNDEVAKVLADEGLRYLYRLLFLFFVESRGRESEILPVKSAGYSLGYSLENIRNLELKRVSGAKNGNYIQNTLNKTFQIMFHGVNIDQEGSSDEKLFSCGFECPKVGTLLFDPKKTPVLGEVLLRDLVMKDVISKLSISEMGKGKKKRMVRISYANLGLNQLGAVYEGLLSLKPVIADDEFYTAILGTRDEEFLIPKTDLKKFKKDQLMHDEHGKPFLHPKGDFLFRTMGYERKYSASFYTDETLTKCLVKECLDEHFKADNGKPSCKKIEEMKILEPAMGSGAFLNETANQLAVYYADALAREGRDKEDGEEIARADLVARAKEFIMRNSLYGVDLNPMATELAKVSLWLNCVHKSSHFAFHDFKIRRGNSLVGAFIQNKASFSDKIHHFLVPMPEMVDTYLEACELKDKKRPFFNEIEKSRLLEIKASFKKADNSLKRLENLFLAVEDLYKSHVEKRISYQEKISQNKLTTSEAEVVYLDYIKSNQEYEKLRLIMDYWCSLWFWDPSNIYDYPDLDDFLIDVEEIIEVGPSSFKRRKAVKSIIKAIPFFHYDLEFPEVFKNGGFDLVLGNPPWAQLSWSDSDFFSDVNHSYMIKKVKATEENKLFSKELESKVVRASYQHGYVLVEGSRNFLYSSRTYPFKDHSKTNTYKYFWQRGHVLTKSDCTYGFIKQGGVLSDKGMEELRPKYFSELSRCYRFINEKMLFEIAHLCEYVVTVFNKDNKNVKFELIDNLYHPITIERCRKSSSSDRYPGAKDEMGNFDLNGHPDRIVRISEKELKELTVLDGLSDSEYLKVSLPKVHGKPEWKLIEKAIQAKEHLGDKNFYWTTMFDETAAQRKGLIEFWAKEHEDISEAVLTGPNIYVGNPFYKFPNPGCKNHADFSEIDLEEISEDYFPSTKYRLTTDGKKSGDHLKKENAEYRIISRAYVSSTGSRTLSSAIYPPYVNNSQNLCSVYIHNSLKLTCRFQGYLQSLIFDFYARNIGGARLNKDSFWDKLPDYSSIKNEIGNYIDIRTLRLNCLSTHYSGLWKEVFCEGMRESPSLMQFSPSVQYTNLTKNWNYESPLRNTLEREQALCEIDALVAMQMGVACDDLVKLYRSQFGALQKKFKDLPGQNEEDSFPRAKLMEKAYQMFLEHFEVTEEQVVSGCFLDQSETTKEVA